MVVPRLDAQHAELHRRDVLWHTRALFETVFAMLARGRPSGSPPRTADRDWTPLIEIEPTEVAGRAAVTLLHRLSYQPGHEQIMGHTLIPVGPGLFEARWVCPTLGPTGVREAMLVEKLLEGVEDPGRLRVRQDAIDDSADDFEAAAAE